MKNIISFFLFLALFGNVLAEPLSTQLTVGDKAPDFTVTDPSGKAITLSNFRGKLVLVNFWTSSCMPCRADHPALYKLYTLYKKLGFDVISVSLDTKKDQWLQAIRSDQISWPNNGIDLAGWNSKLVGLYNLKGTPSSFLISEDGEILQINQDEIALEQTVHYLIFEQPRFYPVVASDKIYFNVIAKYAVVDGNGIAVLKGRAKEVDLLKLIPGQYTITYENKEGRFLKVKPLDVPVTFYPTRVEDVVTLSKESDYYIYNQRGKLEIKGNGTSIDVTQLPLGVYYLCVNGNVESFFKK
ncbi:redoxin family protein [uncultured Cytophaga sp.]|uniref:redoxin family protein n=1 Tax=uncultured Cytophaga sp. TaxID=160238 RepID=UPI00263501C6|nr:redoxin family protein [uncultured Cytophaga sp.]